MCFPEYKWDATSPPPTESITNDDSIYLFSFQIWDNAWLYNCFMGSQQAAYPSRNLQSEGHYAPGFYHIWGPMQNQCENSLNVMGSVKRKAQQLRTQASCDRVWGSLVQNNTYTHQNFCQIFGPHLGKKKKRWFRPFHVLSALVDWQVHRNPKVLGRVSQYPGRSPTPLWPDQKPQNLIIILITGAVVLCLKQS